MDEILNFLAKRVFYVATVEGDKPRVRPFGFAMAHEGKLYFGTNEEKPTYHQLKANPNVEICTTSPDNEWIRVSGRAVFDYRPETKVKAIEAAPFLARYTVPGNPVLALFYIEDGEATFASMKAPSRTVKF